MANMPMFMTENGFGKINANLQRLKQKRLDLADALAESRDGGDTIDNTEYLTLRDEAAYLDERIFELQDILRYAELISIGEPDGRVHLGNTVAVQMEGEPMETYTIVGRAEADPSAGFISNESPLGRALIDKSIGDEGFVLTPEGEMRFKILAVT